MFFKWKLLWIDAFHFKEIHPIYFLSKKRATT